MSLGSVLRPILRSPLTLVGCIMLLFLILTAILAPWIAPYPEHAFGATDIKNKFRPPAYLIHLGLMNLGGISSAAWCTAAGFLYKLEP